MSDPRLLQKRFEERKKTILGNLAAESCDRSPKGTVDEEALPVMEWLNAHPSFVTTSSCSGRMSIFVDDSDGGDGPKGWLMVSHEPPLSPGDFYESIKDSIFLDLSDIMSPTHLASLKFEPFVLHVEAATLEAAQRLLHMAQTSGFRNSGISIGGRSKRWIVAVRSTLKLDLPLASYDRSMGKFRLLLDRPYIDLVILPLVRQKFALNTAMIERFMRGLTTEFKFQNDRI